jgi:hypothetical protein
MELCGVYTGDGSSDKGRVEIAHAVNDPHMSYYADAIRSEFGVEPYVDKRGTASRHRKLENYSGSQGTHIRSEFPGGCFN